MQQMDSSKGYPVMAGFSGASHSMGSSAQGLGSSAQGLGSHRSHISRHVVYIVVKLSQNTYNLMDAILKKEPDRTDP